MLNYEQATAGGFVRATSSDARLNRDLGSMPSMTDHILPRRVPPAANDNHASPRVIGLQGYGGAGKSEVAKALHDYGYTPLHVKRPLRAMAAALLSAANFSPTEIDVYLDGELKRATIPRFKRSGTEIQQFLGTEFGREFCHPDLWLDIWLDGARAILEDGGRVSQESVRFANEATAIRSLGGVVVQVDRPGVGAVNNHQSEHLPTEPDFVIHNNGTIADLRLQVASWLRHAA